MTDDVKVWREGQWMSLDYADGARWLPPGFYDPMGVPEVADDHVFITREQMHKLIPIMEARGIISPRLDERLRTEDLRITHRLLDLLEARGG